MQDVQPMVIHFGRSRTVGLTTACGASGIVSLSQAPTCSACARQLAQRRIRIRRISSPGRGFMRTRTRNDEQRYRIILMLLVALLLLASLPGCTARQMPDWGYWNDVQALPEGKQVEVQVDQRKGSRKIKGYFLSATQTSIAISRNPLNEGGSRSVYEEIGREKIRKILAKRDPSKRWPGWLA